MTADVFKASVVATSDVNSEAARMEINGTGPGSSPDKSLVPKTKRSQGMNTDITRVAFVKEIAKRQILRASDGKNEPSTSDKLMPVSRNAAVLQTSKQKTAPFDVNFHIPGKSIVQPPVSRKVSELRRQEGRSPSKREVRRLVKNLVGSVEDMVQNLHGIVGDLHDLMHEIDVVTDKIERQCDKRKKTHRKGMSDRTVRGCHGDEGGGCSVMQDSPQNYQDCTETGFRSRVRNARSSHATRKEEMLFGRNAQAVPPLRLIPPDPFEEQCHSGVMNVSQWSTQTMVSSVTSIQDSDTEQPPCGVMLRSTNAQVCGASDCADNPKRSSPYCQQPWACMDTLQSQTDSEASKRHTRPCGSVPSQSQRLSYFRFSDSDESLPQILSSSTPRDAMEFKFLDDAWPQQGSSQPQDTSSNSDVWQPRHASDVTGDMCCMQDRPFHATEVENVPDVEHCPDASLQNWREKIERRTGSYDSLTPQMDWSYLGLTDHHSVESKDESIEAAGGAGAIYNNGYGLQPGFHQRLIAALPEWKPEQHHLPYWPSSDLSSIKSSDDEDDERTRSPPSLPPRSRLPIRPPDAVSPLVSRKNFVVSRQANRQKTVTFSGSAQNSTQSDSVHDFKVAMLDSYCGLYEMEMENRLEQLSVEECDASDFSDVEVDVGSDVLQRSVTSCDSEDIGYNREVNTWKCYTMTHVDSDDVVSECASDILNENFIEQTQTNPGFDDVKHHYDDVNFPALVY